MGSWGKTLTLVLIFSFLIPLVTFQTTTVKAQTSRTLVVPDDYPTITDAIGNATNGDTILVRSGIYNESSLQTNKTISLIGEGSANTILNLHPPSGPVYILGQYIGTAATAIDFNANNLVISGLTINSYGGNSITGNHAVIMSNTLNDYAQSWFNFEGNYETISNNTSNTVMSIECSYSVVCANSGVGGITVSDFGSYNSVFDNNMRGVGGASESSYNLYFGNTVNGGSGMYVSLNDILANNTITNCNQGLTTGSNDMIVGNTIINNLGDALSTTGLNNIFLANYMANNAIGILTSSSSKYIGANFTIYDNDFINNTKQTQVTDSPGGPWNDYWNSSEHGNYWSDYVSNYPNASQVASTGIWNTPYYVGGGEQDNYPLVNPFDISSVTLQLPTWTNITVPRPFSTPSFPPKSIHVSSTPTATPTDSAAATLSQSSSPTPTVPEFPTLSIPLMFIIMIGAGFLVYFKKYKRSSVNKP